jgi:predicted transcriptional regulator
MTTLTIELPDGLRKQIEDLAAAEGMTIGQYIARAAGEKLAAVRAIEALRREAASGRREDFERVLNAVPDVQPEPDDRLD